MSDPTFTEFEFTEYIRPNGRKRGIRIKVQTDAADLAEEMKQANWEFSVEKVPRANQLCIQIEASQDEEQLWIEFVKYNSEVDLNEQALIHAAVDKCIRKAHDIWLKAGKR